MHGNKCSLLLHVRACLLFIEEEETLWRMFDDEYFDTGSSTLFESSHFRHGISLINCVSV